MTHFTPAIQSLLFETTYNSIDLKLKKKTKKKTLTSQRRVTSEVSDENEWTVRVEIQDSASTTHGKRIYVFPSLRTLT